MKKRFPLPAMFLITALFFLFNPGQSQTTFENHIIDPNFNGAASVNTADINGDGNTDVLSVAAYAGEVTWYESDGNSPPGFLKHIVDDDFDNGIYVYADTINGDTLPDILGATWDGHQIALWESDGNMPITWTKQVIDSTMTGAHEVKSANINGDEWMDVVAAGAENHQIAWYHNGGGNPIVWTKYVLSSTAFGARSVYPVDIDLDGDIDIVAAAFASDDVLVFYNQGGTPTQFTEETVDGGFNGSHWVHACDIDGDGDIDILGAGYMAGDVAIWYNDGEIPIGWTKFTLDDYVQGALSVVAADLDNDEDLDVIAAGDQAGAVIVWYQEDPENRVFAKEVIDQTIWGAWPVHTCDIDGDEDMDIFATTSTIDDVRWYENLLETVAIDEPGNDHSGLQGVQLYPNPFTLETTIRFSVTETIQITVELFSINGRLIRTLFKGFQSLDDHTLKWDGRNEKGVPVPSGVYFCRLSTHESAVCLRVIKE